MGTRTGDTPADERRRLVRHPPDLLITTPESLYLLLTSNAREADWMFALVRTEPEASKHDGISYLLIEMRTPGIDVRPLKQMTGDADFSEVFFDNVRVPAQNVVGKRGQGWVVSRSTLKHERALIGNASLQRASV